MARRGYGTMSLLMFRIAPLALSLLFFHSSPGR